MEGSGRRIIPANRLIDEFARLPSTARDVVPNLCPNAPAKASFWRRRPSRIGADTPRDATRGDEHISRGPPREPELSAEQGRPQLARPPCKLMNAHLCSPASHECC